MAATFAGDGSRSVAGTTQVVPATTACQLVWEDYMQRHLFPRFMPGSRRYRGVTDWAKSSLSYGNGNCIEVAGLSGNVILMRDTKL